MRSESITTWRATRSAATADGSTDMQETQIWPTFEGGIARATAWISENAANLSIQSVGQILVLAIAYLIAWYFSPTVRQSLGTIAFPNLIRPYLASAGRTLSPMLTMMIWAGLAWVAYAVALQSGLPGALIRIVATLATAWIAIRVVAGLFSDKALSRVLAAIVWGIAALSILGLIGPVVAFLDSTAIDAGGLRISPLTVLKAIMWIALAVWAALAVARLVERRVTLSPNLTPAMQVLITKLSNIVLLAVAALFVLGAVGVDLTALTVLTGAVGLGVGFGLQKAVANFVSGLSMLLDRSIKPGDVISVGETFGWVRTMGGRYVSVHTRDGLEYLIPNEDLITKEVVNWSMSDNQVRIRAPIGVSYACDIHKARALCVEAALETDRVLREPSPLCHLVGFGDSAVDLELRFWINDPRAGIANVKSDVLLKVWDKFKANGIEIPYPQRDLHFKAPVRVNLVPGDQPTSEQR